MTSTTETPLQRVEGAAVYAEHEIEHLIATHGQLPAGIVRDVEDWAEREVDRFDPAPPAAPAAGVQSASPVAAS